MSCVWLHLVINNTYSSQGVSHSELITKLLVVLIRIKVLLLLEKVIEKIFNGRRTQWYHQLPIGQKFILLNYH